MAVVAATFLALNFSADGYQRFLTVQGRPLAIVRPLRTVGEALAAAQQPPYSGAVRAVVSGRVLIADADPARIAVNGRRASTLTPVRPGDQVWVTNGVDTSEPVVERRVVGPPPQLPAIETRLWRPGKPRVEHVRIGALSGEVVSRSEIEPERPPEPETEKVVALTFDDGPDPQWTPKVLEILRDEGVLATFCVVASAGRSFPDLARAQHAAGHTHCDHTVDHRPLVPRPRHQVEAQVTGGADFLTEIDGVRPELFRAPYGLVSPEVVDIAAANQLRVLGWTVDSADYLRPPPTAIVSRVMSQMRPGAIVLLHDGGGDRANTVAALRPLIRALKAQGYTFSSPTRRAPPPPAAVERDPLSSRQ